MWGRSPVPRDSTKVIHRLKFLMVILVVVVVISVLVYVNIDQSQLQEEEWTLEGLQQYFEMYILVDINGDELIPGESDSVDEVYKFVREAYHAEQKLIKQYLQDKHPEKVTVNSSFCFIRKYRDSFYCYINNSSKILRLLTMVGIKFILTNKEMISCCVSSKYIELNNRKKVCTCHKKYITNASLSVTQSNNL